MNARDRDLGIARKRIGSVPLEKSRIRHGARSDYPTVCIKLWRSAFSAMLHVSKVEKVQGISLVVPSTCSRRKLKRKSLLPTIRGICQYHRKIRRIRVVEASANKISVRVEHVWGFEQPKPALHYP